MTTSEPQRAAPVIEMEDVAANAIDPARGVVARHIHWTVNPGDYWAVAGLQGSGKSDFLLMAGGVTAPRDGRYRLFGEEMPIFDSDRLPQRLRLGLVFDGGQLFNHLTVRENVALPLRYHRDLSAAQAAPEVQTMLEWLELVPWADRTPGGMGRNWRKRAGLARALMLRPEVLLVDDPLAGLDFRHATWWLDFLEQLSKGHSFNRGQPMTLVISTSDLRPWKGRARQFAVLKNERLTVLGEWARVEAGGLAGELYKGTE